jgi:hypothetical protein
MAGLDWERDRAKRLPREYASDDLPPTGSFADQARYGVFNRSCVSLARKALRAPADVKRSQYSDVLSQLQCYVAHASHPDFYRKTESQRKEIVGIIRKLLAKHQLQCRNSFHEEPSIIQAAKRLVSAPFQ